MLVLSFLAAVLLHECGHLFALSLFHARIESARLSPFGITLTHTHLSSPIASLTVAAFGPLFGIIGYVVLQYSGHLPVFCAVSLFLSIFNLLPIRTLDGGRIASAALSLWLSPERAENTARTLSGCALLFLWLIGGHILFIENGSPSLFLMALALFFEHLKTED